ncbi:MAG TPA: alkene reductase [Fodinibius sp.]|nr:alkene reductase [Fodinibius sp.]
MNKNSQNPLLAEYNLNGLELPNRVIMAPLTRSRAGKGNVPTELNAKYYRQRASAGLIISEGTQISPQGVGYPDTPGIYSDDQIKGWKKVTKAVHEAGGRIFAQLWHVGRVSLPRYHDGKKPVAPSALKAEGQIFTSDGMQDLVTPRALETDEIPGIVDDYRQAARNAIAAGFDGVEIHGANGYLIEQFIKDGANKRDDRYGGSVENCSRFVLEVLTAVSDEIGSEKTGIRFSPSGTSKGISDSNPKHTYTYLMYKLNDFDLAYIHLMEPQSDVSNKQNHLRNVTAFYREVYEGTIITNVGYDRQSGIEALENKTADLIAYGKLFLANPDLPERFAQDAELNDPNSQTFYGGGEEGYTDYPSMEEEQENVA